MILSDTIIKSKANKIEEYDGPIDGPLFKNRKYKYEILYNYNSRGFRDNEWPTENLQDCIWCIGDSFTVGIGVEYDHIWPQILQKKLQKRTINISLAGASNNWIARHTCNILKEIKPKYLVIHWSYLHRREMSLTEVLNNCQETYDKTKTNILTMETCKEIYDLEVKRMIHIVQNHNDLDDIKNLQDCIEKVSCQPDTNIIHSFIPGFYKFLSVYKEFNFYNQKFCQPFYCIDYGKDLVHYGNKTATKFVNSLCDLF